MKAQEAPHIGRLISDGEKRRDAIHIAIAPVTADRLLQPGEHIGLVKEDDIELVGPSNHNIGMVDPFLKEPVKQGERFYMFLYPNTITSLRHIWTLPEFEAVEKKRLEAIIDRNRKRVEEELKRGPMYEPSDSVFESVGRE